MPARGIARDETRELNGDDLIAEQSEQPPNGTAELLGARPPALGLRPLDGRDHAAENSRQQLGDVTLGSLLHGVDVFHSVLVATLERGRVDALAAREAKRGLRRVSIRIEGDLGRRAAEHLLDLLGALGNTLDDDGKTTGSRINLDAANRNPLGVERRAHDALQFERRSMKIKRGKLLSADFEGKSSHCHDVYASFFSSATGASPTTCSR